MMAFAEMSLLGKTEDAQDSNDGSSSRPPPKKTKMSKLFSFYKLRQELGRPEIVKKNLKPTSAMKPMTYSKQGE